MLNPEIMERTLAVNVMGVYNTLRAAGPHVSHDGGYALVWDDHRTTLRAVTLGSDLSGGRVEVVSGLAPGERVVPSVP